jgi:predicted nuclease of predicted toxin-antitoxin system
LKLLFDENLAPSLVSALGALFPDSAHVHALGLGSADDAAVWLHARDHGFTIVTKDADFHERATILGYPPKVVWIRRGNCSTGEIERILRDHVDALRELEEDKDAGVVSLL